MGHGRHGSRGIVSLASDDSQIICSLAVCGLASPSLLPQHMIGGASSSLLVLSFSGAFHPREARVEWGQVSQMSKMFFSLLLRILEQT